MGDCRRKEPPSGYGRFPEQRECRKQRAQHRLGRFSLAAFWSKYSQQNAQQSAVVVTGTTTPAVNPVQVTSNTEANSSVSGEKGLRSNSRSGAMRLAAQRRVVMLAANQKAAREAKAISTWQSPTSALLKSQNDELLKSLPQLNQSADDLKSFLPNTPK